MRFDDLGETCRILALSLLLVLLDMPPSAQLELALAGESQSELKAQSLSSPCINLAGTYQILGKALPDSPAFYRVKAWPLALDLLLGVPIPDHERLHVKRVQIVQGSNIELVFGDEKKPITTRLLIAEGDRVSCDANRFQLDQSRDVSGDGVHSHLIISRTLSIVGQQDLQIITRIGGTSKFLFIFDLAIPPEEYAAIFQSLDEKSRNN